MWETLRSLKYFGGTEQTSTVPWALSLNGRTWRTSDARDEDQDLKFIGEGPGPRISSKVLQKGPPIRYRLYRGVRSYLDRPFEETKVGH